MDEHESVGFTPEGMNPPNRDTSSTPDITELVEQANDLINRGIALRNLNRRREMEEGTRLIAEGERLLAQANQIERDDLSRADELDVVSPSPNAPTLPDADFPVFFPGADSGSGQAPTYETPQSSAGKPGTTYSPPVISSGQEDTREEYSGSTDPDDTGIFPYVIPDEDDTDSPDFERSAPDMTPDVSDDLLAAMGGGKTQVFPPIRTAPEQSSDDVTGELPAIGGDSTDELPVIGNAPPEPQALPEPDASLTPVDAPTGSAGPTNSGFIGTSTPRLSAEELVAHVTADLKPGKHSIGTVADGTDVNEASIRAAGAAELQAATEIPSTRPATAPDEPANTATATPTAAHPVPEPEKPGAIDAQKLFNLTSVDELLANENAIMAGQPADEFMRAAASGGQDAGTTHKTTRNRASDTATEPLPATEHEPVPAAEPEALPAAEPEALPAAEPEALPATEPEALPAAEPEALPAAEPEAVTDGQSQLETRDAPAPEAASTGSTSDQPTAQPDAEEKPRTSTTELPPEAQEPEPRIAAQPSTSSSGGVVSILLGVLGLLLSIASPLLQMVGIISPQLATVVQSAGLCCVSVTALVLAVRSR